MWNLKKKVMTCLMDYKSLKKTFGSLTFQTESKSVRTLSYAQQDISLPIPSFWYGKHGIMRRLWAHDLK